MMGTADIKTYIIGIILFTLVVVGGIFMINEFREKNSTFADDDKYTQFNNTFNRVDELNTQVGGLRSNIEDADTDFGAFGVLNSLISTTWNSLRLIMSSFSFMDDAYNGLSTFFGVPAWIPTLLILIVTVVIVFAIYEAIFQR